eukprot:7389826-Prymnesium_polylepis.3
MRDATAASARARARASAIARARTLWPCTSLRIWPRVRAQEAAPLGGVDAFISHAWRDDGEEKWDALE